VRYNSRTSPHYFDAIHTVTTTCNFLSRKGRHTLSATTAARAPALESLRAHVITGRARARLSQGDLADKAGLARQTISRLERGVGDVGLDVVQRIADALGVTAAELIAPMAIGAVDDDELERRFTAPESEFVDADELLKALDEAAGKPNPDERFSRAGRPRVARQSAP
jgi:transcriptional regulator with XRE-family HTH domain